MLERKSLIATVVLGAALGMAGCLGSAEDPTVSDSLGSESSDGVGGNGGVPSTPGDGNANPSWPWPVAETPGNPDEPGDPVPENENEQSPSSPTAPTGDPADLIRDLSTRAGWGARIQAYTGGEPAFRNDTSVPLPPGVTNTIRVEVQDGWKRYASDSNEGSEGQLPTIGEGEVWLSWWQRFDESYPDNGQDWQIFVQWHGDDGQSSPPVAMSADGDEVYLRVGSPRATVSSKIWLYPWRGSMDRGQWHHYQLGQNVTTNRAQAWVELWRDGVNVLPRMNNVTTSYNGRVYLKQGMYRRSSFSGTAVTWFAGQGMWKKRPAFTPAP